MVDTDALWLRILLEHEMGFCDGGHVMCDKRDCGWHESFHGTVEEAAEIKFSTSWQEYVEHLGTIVAIAQLVSKTGKEAIH